MKYSIPLFIFAVFVVTLDCGAKQAATTTTAPSTQPASVRVVFLKLGGFAGVREPTIIESQDVTVDDGGIPVTRVSPEQAASIADLIKREKFMHWPTHDSGPGTWNDNFHYEMEVTIDGEKHSVHIPEAESTTKELERLQKLMDGIRKIAKPDRGT